MANANASPTLISFYSEDAEAVRASQLGTAAKRQYQWKHPAPHHRLDEKFIEWKARDMAIVCPELTLYELRDGLIRRWMNPYQSRILEREPTPEELQEYPNFEEYFKQYIWENRNDSTLCNAQSATAYAKSRFMEKALWVQEIREAMLACDNTYTPKMLYRLLYRYPVLTYTPY